MILKLPKMLFMNLTEKENLTRVNWQIDAGFVRFLYILTDLSCQIFSQISNFVWQVQNSHLNLINLKTFSFAELLSTCSKSGIETLEQAVKDVQSLYVNF